MQIELGALLGDGIGPDIVQATMSVMIQAGKRHGLNLKFIELPVSISAHETHGTTMPTETIDALSNLKGWVLGPVTTHNYPANDPTFVNPSGYLRKHFCLYANQRPARAFQGISSIRDDIDLVIMRENTEGFYADRSLYEGSGEFRPDADTVLSLRLVTREASLRIARQAFELARNRGDRRRVTAVHKANVLRSGCGLFLECCQEVAREYPDVTFDDCHVDACALYLITRPETFDVIVTTNMFGDILSDEAAGLVGGLGLAPGLNIGDDRAMAQATHGSAPEIAHLHVANPIAEILSGQMLMSWLAHQYSSEALLSAANDIERAIAAVLREGKSLTPDLGGRSGTQEMTQAIIQTLDDPEVMSLPA